MSFVLNKAKYFLSDKKVTLAILALAIAGRLIQLIYFYNLRFDGSYQVIATQNLVHGHGVSTAKALAGDLSATVYEPLINWPPGYSVLLAPFYILFNHNYIAAGMTLDILSAITLLLVSRRILKILDTPIYFINIYTLVSGFFIYYFYFIASSDAIAITFFVVALYFTILLLESNEHWAKKTTGIIVSLFISAFTKYLFIPVVFVIPLFLLVKSIADNHLQLKKAAIFSSVILALALTGLLTYQKFISGSATYISHPGRGFFIDNLLAAYPFVPASFIKPDTIALLFRQPGVEILTYHIFQWIHFLFVFFVLIYVLWTLYKHGIKGISQMSNFFYLSFFISFAITILLIVLSVRVAKEEILPGYLWTYVEEPRYYGLPNVLVHMAVFVFYQYCRMKASRILKYVFYFLILFLLPEMFRGIIFDVRRIVNFKKEEYIWHLEYRFQKYAAEIIRKAQQKQPVENVVVTGSLLYVSNRVSLYSNVPVLIEAEKINELSSLNTKTPVLLLIILRENDFPNFRPFLSMKGKEVAGSFNGLFFYTVYVKPH